MAIFLCLIELGKNKVSIPPERDEGPEGRYPCQRGNEGLLFCEISVKVIS